MSIFARSKEYLLYQNSKNFWSNVKNWYDINLNWIMNVETQMVSNSLTQKCSFND